MRPRRIAIIATAGALAAGGAGAAIAAGGSNDPGKRQDAILGDAAKRLNVTPDKLRAALDAAEDAQLDAAVKQGDLTQKQADAIKQRRKAAGAVVVPPIGPGGHGQRGRGGPGPGGPGPGGPGRGGPGPMRGARMGVLSDLSKALGLSNKELFTQLRAGKTIAAIAKAQGKSLDDVRTAVKAAAKTRADAAVKAGDLTQKQADAMLAALDKRLQNLDQAGAFRGRGGPPGMPPPASAKPGSFTPAPAAPAAPPVPGTPS